MSDNRNIQQQRNVPSSQQESQPYSYWKNFSIPYIILAVLGLILFLVVCDIAWTIITEGSLAIKGVIDHIFMLFRRARIYPRINKEFIQLFLIAVFAGWAIRRFRGR